jgi:hypothetical protein
MILIVDIAIFIINIFPFTIVITIFTIVNAIFTINKIVLFVMKIVLFVMKMNLFVMKMKLFVVKIKLFANNFVLLIMIFNLFIVIEPLFAAFGLVCNKKRVFPYTVLEKMTGNTSFPNPDPALAEVKAKNDLFTLAVAKEPQGGKQETANKNQLREELVSLLKRLVIYVELTCNGDETMLLSSGFDLHKKASPVGQLPMPEGLKATLGASRGSLVLS